MDRYTVNKNLLSYDAFGDRYATKNKTLYGWLVEKRVSWENKEVSLTYELDIRDDDPYLYEIGIIQDVTSDDEIIQDDESQTDTIQDR